MLFPRMMAHSEVPWSAQQNRNYDDFKQRLMEQFKKDRICGK